jgi:PAS domain S-box-containing protein
MAASWNKKLENKMIRIFAVKAIISLCAFIIGVLLIVFRRQKGVGYSSTIAYAICLSLGAISCFAIPLVRNLQAIIVLKIIIAFITGYLPAFVFTYILGYTSQSRRLSYRILPVMAFVPAFLLVMFFVQSVPSFLFSGVESQNFMVISPVDVWGWLILVYSIGILVASVILTFPTSRNNLKPLKVRPLIILNGAILASIGLESVSFTNLLPMITEYDLILAGFALIGGALLFTNLVTHQMNLITRDELFESINDGIIILNNKDKILDLNPAAEQLIGIPTHQAYGNPVEDVLTNWNSISVSNNTKETEYRGSINLNKEWHHIHVRIHRLDEERGKVIILRDITAQKGIVETRRYAQEEMFNLLRSFFKLANTTQSSRDFFRDVLNQVVYTFHLESGAICLLESLPDSPKPKFTVMAKQGELLQDEGTISLLHKALNASAWQLEDKRPFIVPEAGQNPLLSEFLPQLGQLRHSSIAAFPLLYNEEVLGSLMLVLNRAGGFTSDEIVRLNIVTEDLSSYIFYERKKKSDIAMEERQRLVRDLHDSITQKLYGLVTMTEAVQAGLESGASLDKNDVMARISENARQALREMRLFLYELEPVDIKKEGLISILHQRLASVEGRSDIRARMIADSEILLEEEKEVEVYYIVAEALNNIIKHAKAKSVLVKLKRRKNAVYLEIIDDGCGFNLDQVEPGGKGLRNMQDRAKRIKGKLKIITSPENGTKITLLIPNQLS